ncbi:hypothetical protein [Virgisporangium aliadipatigenens]|uniref:hypothetical protein n=1 Tax=Virgisporangium aliadipatigenens TaxID=741659 RepID=UPI001942ED04|nr:hypothetical protein [Virgisporangium aliadipatigenens]
MIERWIYGGLRLNGTKQVHAWLPEPPANTPLGEELWYGHRGRWVVGGIYQANVARHEQRVSLHGRPSRWLQRYEDRTAVGRWEVLDRQARDTVAQLALERRAAKDTALAEALAPLLAIAATLRTGEQRRALLAYVTAQVYAARARRG